MYIVCIGIQAYVYSTHNIFLSLLFRSLSSSGGDGFSAVSGPVSSGRRPYSEVHGPPGRGDHHTPHRGAGQEGEGGAKEGKKGEGEGRQERRERERLFPVPLFLPLRLGTLATLQPWLCMPTSSAGSFSASTCASKVGTIRCWTSYNTITNMIEIYQQCSYILNP